MKKYIYIVYEIDEHHTKSTFCIKGLSTTKKEAKQFFKPCEKFICFFHLLRFLIK